MVFLFFFLAFVYWSMSSCRRNARKQRNTTQQNTQISTVHSRAAGTIPNNKAQSNLNHTAQYFIQSRILQFIHPSIHSFIHSFILQFIHSCNSRSNGRALVLLFSFTFDLKSPRIRNSGALSTSNPRRMTPSPQVFRLLCRGSPPPHPLAQRTIRKEARKALECAREEERDKRVASSRIP